MAFQRSGDGDDGDGDHGIEHDGDHFVHLRCKSLRLSGDHAGDCSGDDEEDDDDPRW